MTFAQLNEQDTQVLLKLCGALFYYHPNQYQSAGLTSIFSNEQNLSVMPVAAMLSQFHEADLESLALEYDRLFCGAEAMIAPPWGSAYLDKEAVLFGDSTVAYRHFLDRCGFELNSEQKEPEDHLGLMLMVLSMLVAHQQPQQAKELLEQHLLTWSGYFFNRFHTATQSSAFLALAEVTELLLKELGMRFEATPLVKKDYWHVTQS